jgi:hypothetical protein
MRDRNEKPIAPYIGTVTPLGYEGDLDGQAVADPPSVGCCELGEPADRTGQVDTC